MQPPMNLQRSPRPYALKKIILILGAILFLMAPTCGSTEKTAPVPADTRQIALEKMVQQAERHLEHTIKKEGFFSARVALNVWKSTALDAGLYSETAYDAFRRRIYLRSINANRHWFENYVTDKSFHNAAICLEFWRLHSLELGVLDLDEYEKLHLRLEEAKKIKKK